MTPCEYCTAPDAQLVIMPKSGVYRHLCVKCKEWLKSFIKGEPVS